MKRNTILMAANNTERASSFKLSDDKLDELFVKEVDSVTKIVENLPKNDVLLSICSRWFKIFQQAKPKEKFARNYMLLLLHHQLNEGNTLGFPFTDARSYQRDLITLHQMSMSLQRKKTPDDDSSRRSISSSKSNTQNSSSSSNFQWVNNINVQQIENASNQLIEENNILAAELQALKSEKEILLQRQWECKTEINTLRDRSTVYAKELTYMKYIFSCSIVTVLKLFDPTHSPPLTKEPIYFTTLLNVICDDEKDKAKIEELDQRFGKLLRENIDHNMRKAMLPQLEKEYNKQKEEVSKHYKEAIKHKEEIQLKKLTEMSKQYFTRLRNLFVESFKGNKHLRKKVLEFLQQYMEQAKEL